jgi:hypothetical protein
MVKRNKRSTYQHSVIPHCLLQQLVNIRQSPRSSTAFLDMHIHNISVTQRERRNTTSQ